MSDYENTEDGKRIKKYVEDSISNHIKMIRTLKEFYQESKDEFDALQQRLKDYNSSTD